MWLLFASAGATIAALAVILPELWRLARAARTGVIVRKGYAKLKVLRSDDPETFKRLILASLRDLIPAAAMFLVGLVATILQVDLLLIIN